MQPLYYFDSFPFDFDDSEYDENEAEPRFMLW